jgi:hypothetical protein
MPSWRDAGPDTRTAVCVEFDPSARHIFELANAVHFTTGQAFVSVLTSGRTRSTVPSKRSPTRMPR